MKIFLIILLIIVLLILFILFCPLSIKLVYNDNIEFKVGYIFPIFKILPKKSKSEDLKKKSEIKKTSSSKKPKTPKKKNSVLEFKKKHGLDGIIELIKEIVSIVLKTTNIIKKHLVISKLRLDLLVAGDDPADTAMKYGYVCSSIYPMIAILDQNVKLCRHEEYINADFDCNKTKVNFIFKAHIMPVFILIAALSALIGSMKIFSKFNQ